VGGRREESLKAFSVKKGGRIRGFTGRRVKLKPKNGRVAGGTGVSLSEAEGREHTRAPTRDVVTGLEERKKEKGGTREGSLSEWRQEKNST